jgi:hypothetical protein
MSRTFKLLSAALAAVAAFALAGCISPPSPSAPEPTATEPAASEPVASEPAAEPETTQETSEPAAEPVEAGDFCETFNNMIVKAGESTSALMETLEIDADAEGNMTVEGTPDWDAFNPLIEETANLAQSAAAGAPAEYKQTVDVLAEMYTNLRDAAATKDEAKFKEVYKSMGTKEYLTNISQMADIYGACTGTSVAPLEP